VRPKPVAGLTAVSEEEATDPAHSPTFPPQKKKGPTMTIIPSTGDLASLEAAYQTMGRLLSALSGAPAAADSHVKHPTGAATIRRIPSRNYIKFPAPQGLRPRALTPFHVADLCRAYNFPTSLAGGGVIGILELSTPGSTDSQLFCGYNQADLDQFAKLNGLPQIRPIDVSVNGGQNRPGGSGDVEVLLDIQVAAASYFYCTGQSPTIKVFFAPNDYASFAAVINAAADCDVLSISWGADEVSWGQDAAEQLEAAAKAATEKGCVVFASAGDNSSSDGDPGANVDLPSGCPHIIGCGGTTKTQSSEVVWGNGQPDGMGTGGGYSTFFPPQDWQVGAPPSPGKPGRMVPDVAADADPNTGYLVVVNGHEIQAGGTSAVAPLYAGLFAALGRKLGFITPTLWQHPEDFVDITEGSNGSFHAMKGPDPCTGLGVPIGAKLAASFAGVARKKRKS
jgi:kumamolisin